MHISRKIDNELLEWKDEKGRKPLLIRGARQVGKSTAVEQLGKSFDHFLPINFESQRKVHKLFEGDLNPKEICNNLTLLLGTPIIPGKTLLFFDEVQACIPAISSLRFFYEQFPELHVVAAGSLLEFALAEIPSFGVGRIRSMFVYPFSFDEYLTAIEEKKLLNAKREAFATTSLAEPIHQKLITHWKQFLMLGGMPEVVATYHQHRDFIMCGQVLDDLIVSLKTDFAKYKKKIPLMRISEVFDSVVRQSENLFTPK